MEIPRLLVTVLGGGARVDYFYDEFARADGVLGNDWYAPSWIISSGKAVCTPTGTEKLVNGNFSDGKTGWSILGVDGLTNVYVVAPNEGYGGVGTGAICLYRAVGTGHIKARQTFDLDTSTVYRCQLSVTNLVTSGVLLLLDNAQLQSCTEIGAYSGARFGSGLAKLYDISSSGEPNDTTVDNASLLELDITSQLALRKVSNLSNLGMRVTTHIAYGNMGGLAVFDDPANPQNGLLLYVSKGRNQDIPVNLCFDQYLSGVRTNLATVQVSVNDIGAPDREIALVKNGTSYTIRYNHVDIGTYVVAEAPINGCEYYGLFSCDTVNTFDDFAVYAIPVIDGSYIMQNDWISVGAELTAMEEHPSVTNPVLDKDDITGWDEAVTFVADPFVVENSGTYHMFFEIAGATKTEIGHATSPDGLTWTYRELVLTRAKTSFTGLSYPYTFKAGGKWWMIPDMQLNRAELWTAVDFPTKWEYAKTLSTASSFRDSTLFKWGDNWYLMNRAPYNNATVRLYWSATLTGTYAEHPLSPIVSGVGELYARPAGRPIIRETTVDIFLQDNVAHYGDKVRAFSITTLSPTEFTMSQIATSPILIEDGIGWRGKGMHHIDRISQSISIVDGVADDNAFSIGVMRDTIV